MVWCLLPCLVPCQPWWVRLSDLGLIWGTASASPTPSSRKNQPPRGMLVNALEEAIGHYWMNTDANRPTRQAVSVPRSRPRGQSETSQATTMTQNSTSPVMPLSVSACR